MTQALKVGDERAVVMHPSTPRGDGGGGGPSYRPEGRKAVGREKEREEGRGKGYRRT
jgi:hypothetical protein